MEITRLEFSGVEIAQGDGDYNIRDYPEGYITRLMNKANELGLMGKKIKTIEVRENFATNNKYIDFILEKS